MKAFLIVLGIFSVVIAGILAYMAIKNRLEVRREAWVNMFVECPDSSDYGELIDADAPMWRDFNQTRLLTNIEHGTPISLLIDEPNQNGSYRVRPAFTDAGYISAYYISDYDPANGVQPNESECP
jgi:hypothetical protein